MKGVTAAAERPDSRPDSGLKNNTPHWKDTDWEPIPERSLCACGCGQVVIWSGIGRRKKYVNARHQQRHYMRRWRRTYHPKKEAET